MESGPGVSVSNQKNNDVYEFEDVLEIVGQEDFCKNLFQLQKKRRKLISKLMDY